MKLTTFFLAITIENQEKWMLEFEWAFKIKARPRWTVFEISLTSAVICIENRLYNIFKNTNVTKFTNSIVKSSYRALQATSKWKTRKQPSYFLRTVEFWPTVDIQFSNFSYILGNVAELYFLISPQKSFKRGQH